MNFNKDRKLAQRMTLQEAWAMVVTLEKEYPSINCTSGSDGSVVWYICPIEGETLYFVN